MSTIAQRQREALDQEFLTVEQVSLVTQYHVQSIYRMIRKGRISVVRLGGWAVRVPRSELRAIRQGHPRADQSLAV